MAFDPFVEATIQTPSQVMHAHGVPYGVRRENRLPSPRGAG
jgi:hypothetical protein